MQLGSLVVTTSAGHQWALIAKISVRAEAFLNDFCNSQQPLRQLLILSPWLIKVSPKPRDTRPFRSAPIRLHQSINEGTPEPSSYSSEDVIFSGLSLDSNPLSALRRPDLLSPPSQDQSPSTMWRSSSLPLLQQPQTQPSSVQRHNNLVFGQTSLGVQSTSMFSSSNGNSEMEWDPTPSNQRATDQGTWMRTQRFFPTEQPTGLEGVWDSALTLDDRQNLLRDGRDGKKENAGWFGGWGR